jgi:type II secretory pathway pseudopilin PulG
LIELLIVMAILAILFGSVLSFLSVARSYVKRTQTQAVMQNVATALHLFQGDTGVLPWQPNYPATVTAAQPFQNQLWTRLGEAMSASDRATVSAVAATLAGKYAYSGDTLNGTTDGVLPSPLTYRMAYVLPPSTQIHNGQGPWSAPMGWACLSAILNRMAMERARMVALAGATDLTGPIITAPSLATPYQDLTSNPLLVAGSDYPATYHGWCDDYFAGSLSANFRQNGNILDAWGRPLVYVNQVLPRQRGTSMYYGNILFYPFDPAWYGLGTTGFVAHTGPWDSIVAVHRWRLLQSGRVRVGAMCEDGELAPPDATYLPDPTVPMNSDRRFYAAQGYENDFELWSAGPDGNLDWIRSGSANTDNLSLLPYDRLLK